MNNFLLIILAIIVWLVIKSIKTREKIVSKEAGETVNTKHFDPNNYERKQTLMNSSERAFFETLRRAIGDKFDIYPQVNLDKIFKIKYLGNKFAFNGAKWAIDRKSVDYLLVIKETQSPKLAIELDGSSHERQDRIERDEKVGSIFECNGIPLIRFNVSDTFNENELRAKFERYFLS